MEYTHGRTREESINFAQQYFCTCRCTSVAPSECPIRAETSDQITVLMGTQFDLSLFTGGVHTFSGVLVETQTAWRRVLMDTCSLHVSLQPVFTFFPTLSCQFSLKSTKASRKCYSFSCAAESGILHHTNRLTISGEGNMLRISRTAPHAVSVTYHQLL